VTDLQAVLLFAGIPLGVVIVVFVLVFGMSARSRRGD
jgi:hypothetical protein